MKIRMSDAYSSNLDEHAQRCRQSVKKMVASDLCESVNLANTYHLVKKMVKIGPVDPEIIVLK